MYQYHYSVRETDYKVKNKTKKKQVLYIEHPIDTNYELVTPKKAKETEHYYRFTTELKPAKTGMFKVKEKRSATYTRYLTDASKNDLSFYLQKKYINPKILKQIEDVIKSKHAIAELQKQQQELNKEITIILVSKDNPHI